MNSERILKALGAKRHGRRWLASCPSHNDRNPSLSIVEQDGKVLVKCWAGCSQDEVISALKARGLWEGRGSGFGAEGTTRGNQASEAQKDPMKSWRNADPFTRGTAVGRYLRYRGILLTDGEARSLRFFPALWHWPTQSRWPTMLARVSLATGADLGTHQTFLRPDGSGKAPLGEKARLFAAGGSTVGGGVWFGKPDPTREFIVGEGIESTLSAMRIFGAASGCAALSESGVRRLILPAEARKVRVFADNDELGQGVAAAREAARQWRAEGRAVAASMASEVGQDANDAWLKHAPFR
jgi:putative DNA primase/helicase